MSDVRFAVWRSGEALAGLGARLSGVTRDRAEEFAITESAADPERKTWVIDRDDTLRIVAEYRQGRLRMDRRHDARAHRLAREKGEVG